MSGPQAERAAWSGASRLKRILYPVLVLILTFILILVFRGTAHSQEPSGTEGAMAPPTETPDTREARVLIDGIWQHWRGGRWAAPGVLRNGAESVEPGEARAPAEEQSEPLPEPRHGQPRSPLQEPGPSPVTTGPHGEPTAMEQADPDQGSHDPHDGAHPVPAYGESRPTGDPGNSDRGLPPLRARGLSFIDDETLTWSDPMDLALALEIEFQDRDPESDPRVLKAKLQHALIELSVRVGHSDDPRANLDAIRGYLRNDLGIQTVQRETYPLDLIRPSTVLTRRRASPEGTAIIALVLADRLNEYLDLEPVVVGDVLGVRYRSGNHRFTLVPQYLEKLYSDREFLELALGPETKESVRVLTRRQLWGRVISEIGSALWEDGSKDLGVEYLERGLGLHGDHAPARVARARVALDNNDLESALEELDAAVSLAPRGSRARMLRAEIYRSLERTDALEEDLVWLAKNGGHPRFSLQLAEYFLELERYRDASSVLTRLKELDLAPRWAATWKTLRDRTAAAPWIQVLLDPVRPGRDRFEALEHVGSISLAEVDEALVKVMEDSNLRLARLAWRTLRDRSGWDLPFDTEAWRAAMDRRSGDSPAP